MCFRPLAGCGLFRYEFVMEFVKAVSVPLRGVGCFARWQIIRQQCSFPSPCGVWVVSYNRHTGRTKWVFPSPCGVWVVSRQTATISALSCFRPLAGCGLFPRRRRRSCGAARFPSPCGVWVVSPFRFDFCWATPFPSPCGVWVVSFRSVGQSKQRRFPSPCGVWVVSATSHALVMVGKVSVPLRGVGCFAAKLRSFEF